MCWCSLSHTHTHTLAHTWKLAERRAGNDAYSARDMVAAAHHYTRALGIVEFVVGGSAQEQAEVDASRGAALLNLAAVHVETQARTHVPLHTYYNTHPTARMLQTLRSA
jgi:hypothetical protein